MNYATSANYLRSAETFAGQMNRALAEALAEDQRVVVGGQLVRYGVAGLTTGLYDKYAERFITYSVSEALMNSSAMGLALAAKRVVMYHVRMDFLLCGMDALFNHINIWTAKGYKLSITMVCQVGKGMGQGPQHSKNLTAWFEMAEGWQTVVPSNPQEAYSMLKAAIFSDHPTMFVAHRELFDSPHGKKIETPKRVELCGTSLRHEAEFYDR